MDVELITQVAVQMEQGQAQLQGTATLGFDGFIDSIVRVVRGFAPDREPLHFRSKREFGDKIIDLGAHNASFELTDVATKIGGNGPNTAHALGRLGLRVNCIGMLGHPRLDSVFAAMDANCTLHSFADPTHTTAIEFDDGKVLLARSDLLRRLDWSSVRDVIGLDRLVALYGGSDIIGFTNWGELEHATEIWEGVEREILSAADPLRRRIVFFDLADPTRRDRDIGRVLALIGRLSAGNETVLCLNRNEAHALARQLAIAASADFEQAGAAIREAVGVDTLVIRDPHVAMAWTGAGFAKTATFHTPAPLISTGSGDNFNAGYCFARLAGFDTRAALVVASAVAGLYVATGRSPTRGEVVDFLRTAAAAGGRARIAEAAQ